MHNRIISVPMTARFWLNVEGDWVKMALRSDGETVEIKEGGRTEEGYDRTTTTIWRDEDLVYLRAERNARDCDGFTSSDYLYVCHVCDLNKCLPYSEDSAPQPGARLPEWREVRSEHRDCFAEAMGY